VQALAIATFNEGDQTAREAHFETHFEVVADEAARRQLVDVTEALAKLVAYATSCRPPAVFVVPYWAGEVGLGNDGPGRDASLLARLLTTAGYRGPLVHVGIERWGDSRPELGPQDF